jgi:hypothetical protein
MAVARASPFSLDKQGCGSHAHHLPHDVAAVEVFWVAYNLLLWVKSIVKAMFC